MTEQIKSINETRQAYSAPNYDLFSFETSDLIQTSGTPAPVPSAVYLGSNVDNNLTAVSEW